MPFFLSATDFAIAVARQAGTLQIVERSSRLGGSFWAILDAQGVLEVAATQQAAQARVASCNRAG